MTSRMLNKSGRVLPGKDMDLMFHALGRPVDIRRECYRNHFRVNAGTTKYEKFLNSEHWQFCSFSPDRRAAVFHVSEIGVQILGDYIDDLDRVNDDPEATCH